MSLEVDFRNWLAAGTAKHKHTGYWALPKWHSATRSTSATMASASTWLRRVMAGPRIRSRMLPELETLCSRPGPDPPSEWQAMEATFEAFARDNQIVARGDKSLTAVWGMSLQSYALSFLRVILRDPDTWQPTPHSLDDLYHISMSIAAQALPARFVSRGQGQAAAAPRLFALVKSKCWSENGAHTCGKLQHSCYRKVSSHSDLPYPTGMNTMGTGVQ